MDMLTVREACGILNVAPRTLRKLNLPRTRSGASVLYADDVVFDAAFDRAERIIDRVADESLPLAPCCGAARFVGRMFDCNFPNVSFPLGLLPRVRVYCDAHQGEFKDALRRELSEAGFEVWEPEADPA